VLVRRTGLAVGGGLAILLVTAASCGRDGEGPRYIGRVTTVSGSQLCVGLSSSSSSTTCGSLPSGPPTPKVGQCVALFSRTTGSNMEWTKASLNLKVPDSDCGPAAN
jgi:hypothetical protein